MTKAERAAAKAKITAVEATRAAAALDIALSDYARRYGDACLVVTEMWVTDQGVVFVVKSR